MSDLYFGTDLASELDRLQRQISGLFGAAPSSLRSNRAGTFPPINVGTTDASFEIVAFIPGVDPSTFEVSVDKGLLSISGERSPEQSELPEGIRQYARERFAGAFRRVIELPQQADPNAVQARYVDGCLFITVGKREASKPCTVAIQ